jgi:hypothetical protein
MPLDAVEKKLAETEAAIRKLDARLADPDIWRDADHAGQLTDQRDDLRAEMEELESEWLRKSTV